jgi:ABC-type nitrate/sulfonate/bicarbonate transport system permease component
VILKTVEGLAGSGGADRRRRRFRLTGSQQFRKILFPALPAIFVGLRLGLIFAMINIVGVEFLISFGGLGRLINGSPSDTICRAPTARSCSSS